MRTKQEKRSNTVHVCKAYAVRLVQKYVIKNLIGYTKKVIMSLNFHGITICDSFENDQSDLWLGTFKPIKQRV